MDRFTGSVALLRHPEQEEQAWLLKWAPRRDRWEMVVAECLEGESFREALDREVAWQLNLQRNRDYLIASMSRLHIEETLQLRGSCQQMQYVLEFFVVDLYGQSSRQIIEHAEDLQWVSSREILHGQLTTGQQIDELLVTLIRKFELISAH